MINAIQRDEIVKIIGSDPLKQIQKHLTDNEILSRGGKKYSTSTISRILNGDYENLTVEREIINLWETRLKDLHAEEQRKQRLLSASQEYNPQS